MQELSFEEAHRINVKPPGPKSKELLVKQSTLETKAVVYSKAFRIGIDSAQGSTIKDVDGNFFIDWISGICVLNLGHNNPVITAAVKSQIERIWHTLEISTEARIHFFEKLHSVLPGTLRGNAKILTTVAGANACEAAISLAKHVTGRNTIVAPLVISETSSTEAWKPTRKQSKRYRSEPNRGPRLSKTCGDWV